MTGAANRLWIAIARFAVRRIPLDDRVPDGLPGHRSAEARCDHYWPRARASGRNSVCGGDGHYLCRECWYYAPDPEED